MELRETIERIVKDILKDSLRCGKVKSVDKNKCLCVVDMETGRDIPDVRLKAIEGASDKGYVEFPKVDSYVVIAMIEGVDSQWTVMKTFETDGINVGGDKYGGLVKVQENVDRLNAIEDDMNNLKNIFSGWSPVAQDGGAALKSSAATWFGQQLTKTKKSDIENDKIKHGDG